MSDREDIDRAAGILMLCKKTRRFLVQMRSSAVYSHPNTISVPGGHLTRGEVPEEGAYREFCEETGFSGPKPNLLFIDESIDTVPFSLFLAVVNDEFDAEPHPEFKHEVVWSGWMSPDEIFDRTDIHPGFWNSLKKLFKNEMYVKTRKINKRY